MTQRPQVPSAGMPAVLSAIDFAEDCVFEPVFEAGALTSHMESELEFKSFLLDNVSDEIIVHTLDGWPVYANLSFCRNRGYERDEVLAMQPFGWVPAVSVPHLPDVIERIATRHAAVFEGGAKLADGTVVPVEVHAMLVRVGEDDLVVSSARNIAERKRIDQEIHRMAFYDGLTGLANRALFFDRLRIALANSTRSQHPVAVMFVDLDYFKRINDTLGHPAGDALLQSVASRLAVNVREGDTLARLGGDEFTLVIPECSSRDEARAVAAKVLSAFECAFEIGDFAELHVTASLGFTLGTGENFDAEMALAQADTAMYHAKQGGRGMAREYCPSMGSARTPRIRVPRESA